MRQINDGRGRVCVGDRDIVTPGNRRPYGRISAIMRSSSTLAALMLSLACASAGSAAAATPPRALSDLFVRFCGDTQGDADQALQQADAEGWATPPPMALTPVPFGSGKWTDLRGRWTRADGALMVIEVGTIRDPDGKSAVVCTVAETPPLGEKAAFNPIERALQHWVGHPPAEATDNFAIFAFRTAGAQRVALTGAQESLAVETARTHADTALVSIADVFGLTPTITYMRWR